MIRKVRFNNKDRNKSTLQSLSQALSSRDKTTINTGSINPVQSTSQKEDDISGGASNLVSNGLKLGKVLYDNYQGGGGEGSGLFASAANDYISGSGASNGIFGDAANSYISGGASSGGSLVGDAIGSEVGSGAGSSGGGGFGGGGVPWAMIANVGKGLYNNISDKTPEDYSDTEQAVIYPLQGAANGSMFGPWGALGGLLYGLGYAFKDDIGLKDSNFFTQMLFPIGMGDGGGLRIGGESILDIL